MKNFDCLIPCRDHSKVTLGAVAESYGYNVLIEEGNNANENRIKLFQKSNADYVIFCDDTDDQLFNIRKELAMSFEDNPEIDLIYFSFIDYRNLIYPYQNDIMADIQFGASPWSMAFRRKNILPYIKEMFDPSLEEYHGSHALLRAFKRLGKSKILYRPYIGYKWNMTPGGITDQAMKSGVRTITRERFLAELRNMEKENAQAEIDHLLEL